MLKNSNLVFAVLALLVVLDMVPVNRRYLNKDNFEAKQRAYSVFNPSQADQFILQDKDPNFRVFNLTVSTFNDAITSYHHKSIGGYHAAKLGRYSDLILRHIGPERNEFVSLIQSKPTDSTLRAGLDKLQVLNMLNTRYLIIAPTARPVQNPSAMGNAWFVPTVQFVESPLDEINALNSLNPLTTAVIDQHIFEGSFAKQLEGFAPVHDATARITQTEFAPNRLLYESTSTTEGLAIFSEIFYDDGKGWQAYIDGKPVPHLRANYILRGLRIPAGTHQVEFKFEPASFFLWNKISLFFSILLWLGLLGVLYLELKSRGIFAKKESI